VDADIIKNKYLYKNNLKTSRMSKLNLQYNEPEDNEEPIVRPKDPPIHK